VPKTVTEVEGVTPLPVFIQVAGRYVVAPVSEFRVARSPRTTEYALALTARAPVRSTDNCILVLAVVSGRALWDFSSVFGPCFTTYDVDEGLEIQQKKVTNGLGRTRIGLSKANARYSYIPISFLATNPFPNLTILADRRFPSKQTAYPRD